MTEIYYLVKKTSMFSVGLAQAGRTRVSPVPSVLGLLEGWAGDGDVDTSRTESGH